MFSLFIYDLSYWLGGSGLNLEHTPYSTHPQHPILRDKTTLDVKPETFGVKLEYLVKTGLIKAKPK